VSEVRYARVGDDHVAYRIVERGGRSGQTIVMMGGGTASMEAYADDPVAARLVEGLASLGRLVMVDRRGVGLSDPLPPDASDLGAVWAEDLAAVIAAVPAAAGAPAPVVFLPTQGLSLVGRFAGTHGHRARALVMFEPLPMRIEDPALRAAGRVLMASIRGETDWLEQVCPTRAGDPAFRSWYDRAGRSGASPSVAARLYELPDADTASEIEAEAAVAAIPALLLRRPENPLCPTAEHDAALTLLPETLRVDLPGADVVVYGAEVETLLAEIARFVTGEELAPAPSRALAAVLFTDLADSTERAAAVGDERWQRMLDVHDDVVRTAVRRHGGRVVKTTGDGVLAVFPSASGALHAGLQIRAALEEHDLAVRIGVHVGDIDRRGDDVSGVAVHVAARVMAAAVPLELLVSDSARFAAAGEGFSFERRGAHAFKGLPGEFALFACAGRDPS